MEKETRNRIQRATQAARRLLEHDYAEQLEGVFDIRLTGTIPAEAPAHLTAAQCILRAKMVAAIDHHRAAGMKPAEAVEAYRRETVFTTLNRFVALKMMEARELVQECVSQGEQSAGFREFAGLAPGLAQQPDHGYRLYLEAVFDELSTHIRVLFDRTDATALLWPRRAALETLLATLNADDLAEVWTQDETIGWIYQYYNDDAERKQMRAESAAPRNSRELAVRNQFFTPRYVVEFLTDNTLGRIWYEMRQGHTALKERCRYLVRRPTEIFLQPDEAAPELLEQDGLSQEELLRQPVYIPHRPLKDPREIRLLDPACGSMHFGLYAFDLYLTIYEEAWDLATDADTATTSESFTPFVVFAASFPDKAAFLREVPRLIVEHNIHGIDIDPRAVQIANLSLWLRTQRAWNALSVRPAERPSVARSNIVCAEPMPGEKELLREFVEQQFPAGERPAFNFLLETIFDHMMLAGEAGSLLRIEEEIRTAIADAKRLWEQGSRAEQGSLFDEPGVKAVKGEQPVNLSGITDEQFWERAEQRMYDALEAYAGQAENGGGFQRRLFAEDAAQGFAFIDICRKRYDVVVMNPPFGESVGTTATYLNAQFPSSKHDFAIMMVERWILKLSNVGALGAITTRTPLFNSSSQDWRKNVLDDGGFLYFSLDLGGGVLDAMVETAAYIVNRDVSHRKNLFLRLTSVPVHQKDQAVNSCIGAIAAGHSISELFIRSSDDFRNLPNSPLAYWLPPSLSTAFKRFPPLCDSGAEAWVGLQTSNDDRFLRLWWEVSVTESWRPFSKGGEASPYFADIHLLVSWSGSGREMKAYHNYLDEIGKSTPGNGPRREFPFYFEPGLTWVYRTERFHVQPLPAGCITSTRGPGLYSQKRTLFLLAFLNSNVVDVLIKVLLGRYAHPQFDIGDVNAIPLPTQSDIKLDEIGLQAWRIRHGCASTIEEYRGFDANFIPLLYHGETIESKFAKLSASRNEALSILSQIQNDIDRASAELIGVSEQDREALRSLSIEWENYGITKENKNKYAQQLVSYNVGCAFGRWDIRYATGERPAPELPDPFAPLPVCPPGMLQGDDGLPLSPEAGRRLRAEGRYPLDVAWEGILVDDPEHPLDLERRVRDALAVIWGDRVEAIEREACEILGVASLREWFRKPAAFFADHLKRYSKSRRQAPIYWPLSSASGSYTVWLYYHRFSADTLYRALDVVNEKVAFEERKLAGLASGAAGGSSAGQRKTLTDQEALVTELRAFQAELAGVAPLWNPNLNDGVILNYGPLWRMIGHTPWQKSVKEKWDDLVAGKYDWAHLALHLWPERVVPKCAEDRSLTIAHGLEEVFWVEGKDGKWSARPAPTRPVEELVRDRTSPAVKAALEGLLNAPAPAGNGRGPRKRK